jgi:phosphate:Na+ symporter
MVESIEWIQPGMGLFGGLALFLFGMDLMTKGLRAVAGEGLRTILAKLTRNRVYGALTGALVTAALNSSSVTTVLMVGFVTAGLMTLSQSIGVIMGANIGSTVTAQIVAFNVTQYSLGMIAVGFTALFVGKSERTRQFGSMVLGLGLIFFGMGVMGQAMEPLRSYPPFLDVMTRMEHPLLGILVAAIFTGLIQSSAATTGIVIVMASEGLVTLPAGIALALGANIGTCVTAVLAAIGKPTEARRAAVVHVLFNVAGVLLWLPFIDRLAEFVRWISPAHPDIDLVRRMAAETPRQIANAHTTFNIVNTLIFLPFTGAIAALVQRVVPDRPVEHDAVVAPLYLDDELLSTPTLALERVRLELGHQGEIVREMLHRVRDAFYSGLRADLAEVIAMDDRVDLLQKHILKYLGQIRRSPLIDATSDEFIALMSVSDYLESVGDTIETNLVEAGEKLINRGIAPSETAQALLDQLYTTVDRALEAAVRGIRDDDPRAVEEVLALRSEVAARIERVLQHQAGRLGAQDPMRPTIFRVEMAIVDGLKRIYTLSKRIARVNSTAERPPSG